MEILKRLKYFAQLMMNASLKTYLLSVVAILLTACRTDYPDLVRSSSSEVAAVGSSFFLLNEGNMGSNKATIDFYDARVGKYNRNIFSEINPDVTFELGDVGNDLAVYGSRLYAVINCSNLIEVMDARSARHVAKIDMPNPRNIVFHGSYAYVSSYAGPIVADPNARQGYVARIDTATLQVVDTCVVGFQPEGMAIVDNRLFVANSGGYRAPDYDRTLSVIDLTTFREMTRIDVAPNLNQIALHNKKLYVGSRGNYADAPADIYVVNAQTMSVEGNLGIPANSFCISGNDLLAVRGSWEGKAFVRYDIENHLLSELITDGTDEQIRMPYTVMADPNSEIFYVTDARDYISPGTIYAFSKTGTKIWNATTGDIPAHFAFTDANIGAVDTVATDEESIYITKVFDYRPAPGQFVNVYPSYTEGDTQESMNNKVLETVGYNRRGLVSLGGFGGYVVVGFNRSIINKEGADFRVLGNAFAGNSEPGIVSVMADDNGNGLPDDTWYEIAGSEADRAVYNYSITYHSTPNDHQPVTNGETWCYDSEHIRWTDNAGQAGYLIQNIYHRQNNFPQWLDTDTLTFTATKLPNNFTLINGTYTATTFPYGYADNVPNADPAACIDIDWATDRTGNPIHLPKIDFIRIHTATNQQNGQIGETSTEFTGITLP